MSKLLHTGHSLENPGGSAPQIDALFTVADVAAHLQLSSRTIRRLIAKKKLPVVRIGRAVRVRAEAVEALLNGQEMTGADNNGQN
jgi:excisionase family DNA binding protein